MIAVPHDTTDTLLAPVALRLDQQLEELSALDQKEFLYFVALSTDREPHTHERRCELLMTAVTREVDCHGWGLSWDQRGLRLTHGGAISSSGCRPRSGPSSTRCDAWGGGPGPLRPGAALVG